NRDNKVSYECRYYLTSLNGTAERFGECTRKHWQVENSLPWVLDVNFNDDGDHKRAKNSATNFSMVKRAALNILKKDRSKGTMKTK
ncbi:MAG: ISAs1 family transposase, partial [Bdellovibrionaceae bacterium]|nr:ISAs1 family transposase [Pseudobdellovibrionaceae bacterium]